MANLEVEDKVEDECEKWLREAEEIFKSDDELENPKEINSILTQS